MATVDLTPLVSLGATEKHSVYGTQTGGEPLGEWQKAATLDSDGKPVLDVFGDPTYSPEWVGVLDDRGEQTYAPVTIDSPVYLVGVQPDSGTREVEAQEFHTIEEAVWEARLREGHVPSTGALMLAPIPLGATRTGASYDAVIVTETDVPVVTE